MGESGECCGTICNVPGVSSVPAVAGWISSPDDSTSVRAGIVSFEGETPLFVPTPESVIRRSDTSVE